MANTNQEKETVTVELKVPVGQKTLGRRLGEAGPDWVRISMSILLRSVVCAVALILLAGAGGLSGLRGIAAAVILAGVVLFPLVHCGDKMEFYAHGIIYRGMPFLFRTARATWSRGRGLSAGLCLWMEGMERPLRVGCVSEVQTAFARFYVPGGAKAMAPEGLADDRDLLLAAAGQALSGRGNYSLAYAWHKGERGADHFIAAFRRGELALVPIRFSGKGKEIVPEEPVTLTPGDVGELRREGDRLTLLDRNGETLHAFTVEQAPGANSPKSPVCIRQKTEYRSFWNFVDEFGRDSAAATPVDEADRDALMAQVIKEWIRDPGK